MRWTGLRQYRQRIVAAWLIAMSISHAVLIYKTLPQLRRGYQDFTIFYAAGKLVRNGHAADLYNSTAQYRTQQEFAPEVSIRRGALPYTHTPFEALIYAPLSFLEYPSAYVLWTAINIVLLIASLVLLRKHFDEICALDRPLLVLSAAGFFPVAIALIQGQDTILLLFLMVLAMVLMKRGRDAVAGAVLGLALFKFHLVGTVALLVSIRRPRLLLGFIPVALALVAACVGMVGWHGIYEYAHYLVDLERTGARGSIIPSDMANLRGFISTAIPSLAGIPWLATIVFSSIILLALVSWRIAKGRESIYYCFALAATAAMLVSYHALPYDLVLLLPAAIVLLADALHTDSWRGLVLAFLLFLTPLYLALWFHLRAFSWLSVLLLWVLWELSEASRARNSTIPSIGR